MVEERRSTQDTAGGLVEDTPSLMEVDTHGKVVDSTVKSRGVEECGSGEVKDTISGIEVHHKLPGNTFECLALSEEECPSEVAKNLDVPIPGAKVSADFSDTSPTFHTFKQVKRIDELDFTPVPLSKKKLRKLKKQKHLSKEASVMGGSNLISNG